jgi:hypothetical protein
MRCLSPETVESPPIAIAAPLARAGTCILDRDAAGRYELEVRKGREENRDILWPADARRKELERASTKARAASISVAVKTPRRCGMFKLTSWGFARQ